MNSVGGGKSGRVSKIVESNGGKTLMGDSGVKQPCCFCTGTVGALRICNCPPASHENLE